MKPSLEAPELEKMASEVSGLLLSELFPNGCHDREVEIMRI